MSQEPNNTDEQQTPDPVPPDDGSAVDDAPESNAAEQAVPAGGVAEVDDIQALMEEAETSAAGTNSGLSDADELEEAAMDAADLATLVGAEEDGPDLVDADDSVPAPVDDVAITEETSFASADWDGASAAAGTSPFEPPEFGADGPADHTAQLDLLDDVELDVKIELGRTEMYIEDVLGLGTGSVVALDKAAGDPVDIFVNERLVARGEVLVLNDNFCVRINDIVSPVPELEEQS
jgi:flagellar motor switch protein FliN/FliY